MNLATEKQIAKALAFQLGFPYVALADNPHVKVGAVLGDLAAKFNLA